jgi:hypothetical protein
MPPWWFVRRRRAQEQVEVVACHCGTGAVADCYPQLKRAAQLPGCCFAIA